MHFNDKTSTVSMFFIYFMISIIHEIMKNIPIFLLLFSFAASAQVGIGTTNPTTTLDVNGPLRVRSTVTNNRESVAKDSILVSDSYGNIQRISSKMVVQSHLKTFIKGGFSNTTVLSLTLSSGVVKIPFNFEDFDENDEFETTSSIFTAKTSGIYTVNVQIKSNASSVATNFGVAILKNEAVIARNGFANIGINLGITSVNVTPPIRSVQTLVKLDVGDTIKFIVYTDLINIGLISNKEDSFFTIQQVR